MLPNDNTNEPNTGTHAGTNKPRAHVGTERHESWYKRKGSKWLVGVAVFIAFILTSILAIYAIAGNFSSHKALFDATNHILQTPGTYHITSDGTDVELAVNNKRYMLIGTIDDAEINVIVSDEKLYIKSTDHSTIVKSFLSANDNNINVNVIGKLLDTLDGEWLELDLDSSLSQSSALSSVNCFTSSEELLNNNFSAWTELTIAYNNNPIFHLTTPGKDKYRLVFDETKLDGFHDSLSTTSLYKSSDECESALQKHNLEAMKGLEVTLMLTQPEHVPTSIDVKYGNDEIEIVPDYTTAPKIEAPKDSVGIPELLSNLFGSL